MQTNKHKYLNLLMAVTLISCSGTEKLTHAEYAGEDLSHSATITRDKQTKKCVLTLKTDDEWTLYAGPMVEHINFDKPVAQGEKGGIYALPVPDSVRSCFQLVTSEGRAILAERVLPMEKTDNVRDLGGYPAADGRHVKWGQLFRAGDLHLLSDSDLTYLNSIPLKSVVDLRMVEEAEDAKDRYPKSLSNYYIYSIVSGFTWSDSLKAYKTYTSAQTDSLMMANYRWWATDSTAATTLARYFRIVADSTKRPILVHCSDGKDRTGVAAALLLYALGVDEETIMQDYLLSNRCLQTLDETYGKKYPDLRPMLRVKLEYILTTISLITKEYGSVEDFLQRRLGVNIKDLRDQLLE